MKQEDPQRHEFRLTSPDGCNEPKRRQTQHSRDWDSEFGRVDLNRDQLKLWFEDVVTHANQEFAKSFRDTRQESNREVNKLAATIGALLMIGWLFRATKETHSAFRPPFNAEYVLYLFLRREERDEVVGDLIESYGHITQRFGKRRADVWFYKQVAGSMLPLFRRSLLRLGAFVWIGRILRRLIS